MKKTWRFFWIITVLAAAATIAGGALAAGISGIFCAAWIILGIVGWVIFYAHFRTIKYFVEKDRIIIRGGFFIRLERVISIPDILWSTTMKFGSAVLFSVVYTAAGKAVIFAFLDCGLSAPPRHG